MPKTTRLSRLPLLLLLLAAADPAPGADSPAKAEFAAICRRFSEGSYAWYGEGRARALRRDLDGFRGSAAEQAALQRSLGLELLKLGRSAEAVAALRRGLELVAETPLRGADQRSALWTLALAYLQLGEDENCVELHSEASCILPIQPQAVHRRPEAVRQAARTFQRILEEAPSDLQAAWLLNLARQVAGDGPAAVPERWRLPAGAFAPEADVARWRDRGPELGTNVVDLAGGAVMDDFDGDGLLDLVTSTWDPCGSLKAFRNDGRGGFEDVTAAWGLDEQLGGLNLVHADYDNDGHLDLLVLRGGWLHEDGRVRNSLLRNQLRGEARRFVDVTHEAGLALPAYPTLTAAWADDDGDGDLDLYVGNEGTTAGEVFPSQLFRNRGDGTFVDVAREAGVQNLRFAKGVAWGDYDDDGRPDLYVSNIGPNRLYRNNGDGTFTDVAPALGVTRPEGRSFATWFFDFDNDGDLDLFVADYDSRPWQVSAHDYGEVAPSGWPLLYRNQGGRFVEVSQQTGWRRPLLPMGANYGDLDNDGWLDVYLGTGEPGYEAVMPNVAYLNRGGVFQEVTFATGLGHLQKGHGVAFGDVDGDGDQDLLHQLGGLFAGDAFANALFENPNDGRRWITLRLQGVEANRFGVGARLEVRVREGRERRSLHRLAGSGGSFGGSSLQEEIGLGEADAIEEIVVRWPGSGTVDRVRDVAPDRVYLLVEGSGRLAAVEAARLRLGAPPAPKQTPAEGTEDFRRRASALAARGEPWSASEVEELLGLLLVDARRFVVDEAFRRAVLPRLATPLDPPLPAALRDLLLEGLNQVRGVDFAASEAVEHAWGAAPRRSLERRVAFRPARGTVALDESGPIVASVYSLSAFFFPPGEAAALLSAVRRQAPQRRLLALVDPALQRALEPLAGDGLHLVATYGRPYSPWPRDPFGFLTTPAGGVELLLRPDAQPGREEDAFLGLELLQGLPAELDRDWGGVTWSEAPVPFHNGQLLVAGGRTWMSLHSLEPRILALLGLERVPVATFAEAAGRRRYLAAARQAAEELAAVLGHPAGFVHPLPDGEDAAAAEQMRVLGGGAGFDLDSLLTVLPGRGGRSSALVADVSFGRELLDRLTAEDWRALRSGYGLEPEGPVLATRLGAAQATPRARDLDAYLDLLAAHLAGQGLQVTRLPLLLVPVGLLRERAGLSHPDFLLGWNNVVLDERGGRRTAEGFTALLPTGDAEARRRFAAAGWELVLLPSLPRSVVLNGGYRCASNHLRRGA